MSVVSRVSGVFTIPQIIEYIISYCSNGAEASQVNGGVSRPVDPDLNERKARSPIAENSTKDGPFLSSLPEKLPKKAGVGVCKNMRTSVK
jgi:hypothetical protein